MGFAGAFFTAVFVVLVAVFAAGFADSFSACEPALRAVGFCVAGFDVGFAAAFVVVGFFSCVDFGCLSSFLILIVSPLSEFPIGFVLVDVFGQNLCNQQFLVFAQKALHRSAWRDKE